MKKKYLFVALAAVLAVGGFCVGWVALKGRTASGNSNVADGAQLQDVRPEPGKMHRPPDPLKKYRDLTPEERVKRVRQGPIGG